MKSLAASPPPCSPSSLAAAGCADATAPPGTSDGPVDPAPAGPARHRARATTGAGHARQAGRPADGTDVPATTGTVTLSTSAATPRSIELDRQAGPARCTRSSRWPQQGYFTDTECHRLSTSGHLHPAVRRPDRHRTRRPRLHLRRRARARPPDVPGRHGGDGERRAQHQRLAVLPRLRGHAAAAQLHGVRAPGRGVNQVIADLAARATTPSYGDGTGRPNAPAVIITRR